MPDIMAVGPENFYSQTRFPKPDTTYLCQPGAYDVSDAGRFWPHVNRNTDYSLPVTIEGVEGTVFTGWGRHAAAFNLGFQYRQNLILKNLEFRDIQGHAVFCRDSSQIFIDHCKFHNVTGGSAIHCNTSTQVVISNCQFEEIGQPVDVGVGNAIFINAGKKITVHECQFKNCGHYAMIFQNSSESLFHANHVDNHWGGGIGVLLGSKEILILNNHFSAIGRAFPDYPKAAIQISADKNTVSGNIISSTAHANPAVALYAYTFRGQRQNCIENNIHHNLIYLAGGPAVVFMKRTSCVNSDNLFTRNVIYRCNQNKHKHYGWAAVVFDDFHAHRENKWAGKSTQFNGNAVRHNVHDEVSWLHNGFWSEPLGTQFENQFINDYLDNAELFRLVNKIPEDMRP